MNQWIQIKSPATVANMVCGFDILGFAVESPYDEMEMRLVPRAAGQSAAGAIKIINIDAYNLPTEPEKNVAGAALIALIEEYEEKQMGSTALAFEVKINKLIKPGSGVGSSAASSAGAVVGANHLLGNIFSKDDLVRFAMNGEKVASGVKHADNISPCLLGGTTLIRSIQPLDVVQLPTPDLFIVVVHPQIEVRTSDARQILKTDVSLKLAIKQWGNIAGLVAGLIQGDMPLISRSMEDVIIEPARSILIPGFDQVKQQCMTAGALGGGISGSGPSIFMLCQNQQTAEKVEEEMKKVYTRLNIHFRTYLTRLNKQGIKIA